MKKLFAAFGIFVAVYCPTPVAAQSYKDKEWSSMVNRLTSAGNKVRYTCFADDKNCTYAIRFFRNGKKMIAIEVEGAGGRITQRLICRFETELRRECLNFDTEYTWEQIYDSSRGAWVLVN